MKATHNINVNGVWYKAGDEYPDPEANDVKKAEQPDLLDATTFANDTPSTKTAEATTEKSTASSRRKKTTA